jgi:uncharacterized membrane protein
MKRRPLSGILFLALAGLLAWGGTVDPGKSLVRWIVVPAMAAWGIFSLVQERSRIEQVYAQILAMGLAIAAVGWLTPGSDSRGLMVIGGLLAIVMAGVLIWSWSQGRARRDDTDQPS